jgi:hypothetical protein
LAAAAPWSAIAAGQDAPAPPATEVTQPVPSLSVAEPKPLVGLEDGLFLRTGDEKFKLRIGGQLQARLLYERVEEFDAEAGATNRHSECNVSIPRGRLKLDGNAFSKRLRYSFLADFGKGTAALKEYWLDAELVEKRLHLTVGQFKRPFSRQQITSSARLELVDTAITDKAFGAGYDLGVMLHDNYTKSPTFEWALGVFNGTGERSWFEGAVNGAAIPGEEPGTTVVEGQVDAKAKFTNVPEMLHPLVVARLGFNTPGLKGYSEADLEGGPARFGIGVSGLADLDADGGDDSAIRVQLDTMFKAQGFSATGGLYLATAQDGAGLGDQAYEGLGWHVQTGYVIRQTFQPAVRYGALLPRSAAADRHEVLAGLAIYFFGHNLKWQTDGGALIERLDAGKLVNALVRTQLQLAF